MTDCVHKLKFLSCSSNCNCTAAYCENKCPVSGHIGNHQIIEIQQLSQEILSKNVRVQTKLSTVSDQVETFYGFKIKELTQQKDQILRILEQEYQKLVKKNIKYPIIMKALNGRWDKINCQQAEVLRNICLGNDAFLQVNEEKLLKIMKQMQSRKSKNLMELIQENERLKEQINQLKKDSNERQSRMQKQVQQLRKITLSRGPQIERQFQSRDNLKIRQKIEKVQKKYDKTNKKESDLEKTKKQHEVVEVVIQTQNSKKAPRECEKDYIALFQRPNKNLENLSKKKQSKSDIIKLQSNIQILKPQKLLNQLEKQQCNNISLFQTKLDELKDFRKKKMLKPSLQILRQEQKDQYVQAHLTSKDPFEFTLDDRQQVNQLRQFFLKTPFRKQHISDDKLTIKDSQVSKINQDNVVASQNTSINQNAMKDLQMNLGQKCIHKMDDNLSLPNTIQGLD